MGTVKASDSEAVFVKFREASRHLGMKKTQKVAE